MDKEKHSVWIIAVLLLLPHLILTIAIFTGKFDITVSGIESFKDFLESLYYCATFIAVVYAIKAYDTWKYSLQSEWDRDTKHTLHKDISDTGEYIIQLGDHFHKIERISIAVRLCIEQKKQGGFPSKPRDYNFQPYYDIFENNNRLSLKAQARSASDEFLTILREFEEIAFDFTREVSDLHRALSDVLPNDDSGPLQMRMHDLDDGISEKKLDGIYELYRKALKKHKDVANYKPLKYSQIQ